MSMISAQIDELRELAGDGSMEWVAGPIRASVLRDAADTIWQLRDDLQRSSAAVQDSERLFHANVEKNGEILRLVGESAKMRELVRDMCVWAYIDSDCDLEDRFADRMRELGVGL